MTGARTKILRNWDPYALETVALTPQGAATCVLVWNEPQAVDAGPSPALAEDIAKALVALGEVAFRWRGVPPTGARLLGKVPGHGGKWHIVATSDAVAAVRLFEEGWETGAQAALVGADEALALAALASTDLRATPLQGSEILFAAIVDGAGALLAASSPQRLAQAEAAFAAL